MSKPLNATTTFLGPASAHTRLSVHLRDVHGLWGGREVYVRGNGGQGQAVVRPVSPPGHEQRFVLALPPGVLAALVDALLENDFASISVPQRMGRPDEARPEIRLTNAAGETRTVAKWAGDRHAAFEAVYAALRAIEARAVAEKPIYEGPFDWQLSLDDPGAFPHSA